jgi:beta-glucosidase
MRTASHNILYTTVNSRAYDSANAGMPTWQIILICIDVLLVALIAFLEYRAIKTFLAKKKEMEPAVEDATTEEKTEE